MKTVIVIAVMTSSLRVLATAALLAAPFGLASCSAGGDKTIAASTTSDAPACPTTPVNVVVSVDQWGDIVSQLGGGCAKVKTVLASSSVDPHDYEPSPADAVTFQDAQLVVVDGGHYDEWATKLAASSAPNAPVVNAIETSGADDQSEGTNPHVWYSPAAVTGVADAVTAQLSKLAPRRGRLLQGPSRRLHRVAEATTTARSPRSRPPRRARRTPPPRACSTTWPLRSACRTGRPRDTRPRSSNEADPSPADLDAFHKLLAAKGVDVLIYNTQTEGSVPEQIRSAAQAAGIPVVNVTETVAPGAKSFEAWQVDQLTDLAKALGVSA